ncbi:DUF2283 domain-containing protein [Candidatus Uhrbacteria bacterium]|nr:DUF2283 domain-containing protein [Candidatus Uhrbacteria bacterium]
MPRKQNKKISYEKEADILRVELARVPIDYAQEMGPFVIHFSKRGIPVYVEVLNASRFLKESEQAFVREGVFAAPQMVQGAMRAVR